MAARRAVSHVHTRSHIVSVVGGVCVCILFTKKNDTKVVTQILFDLYIIIIFSILQFILYQTTRFVEWYKVCAYLSVFIINVKIDLCYEFVNIW